MPIYSEEELLTCIANGDVKAFDQLFTDMYPAICLLATRLLNNEEMARDIASEVFLQLWEKRASLSHIKDLKAYLYISARNRAFNQLKKIQRSEVHEANAVREMPHEQSVEEVLHAIYDTESLRVLKDAINKLPAECRKVVILGIEGYSSNDIAQQLGISASAVSNQKARAMRLLKQQLPLSLLLTWEYLFH